MIIIKKRLENIGWSDKLNFYNIDTSDKLQLKSYNGCICIYDNGKKVGYNTFANKSKTCNINLNEIECPF